ncbi:MAG: SufE family protein [Candidatus Caenarcaniphilales bacterium]|jgi:cysteine desulfuration protein SufE|nr:SufE family protein [Candidatus Caenarcaniphilales bacterium]
MDNEINQYQLTPTLLKRFNQFCKITDTNKRFERIIELGKKLPALDDCHKTENNQVKGCASLVYIIGECINNQMHYQGNSNSHLVQGLIALLIEGFNGNSPQAILEIDPKFIEEMGLAQTLTASRANGFLNALNLMRGLAKNHVK